MTVVMIRSKGGNVGFGVGVGVVVGSGVVVVITSENE